MRKGAVIFWSLLVALAFFRIWDSYYHKTPSTNDCAKQIVAGHGKVIEEPERKDSGQVFVVKTSEFKIASTSKPCIGGLLIRTKTKLYPQIAHGDRIYFEGRLSEPYNFQGEGGRTFDYRNYLAKDDIYYEIRSAKVSILEDQSSSSIFSILFGIKRRFVTSLNKSLGEPYSALASGLVVGEKAAMGKDLLADFRIVGLIHIVVLSGYNITIVADAFRRILSFLPRVWGITFGGLGIFAFGIMVGGGATVVRSCLMAGIALLADLIRRDYSVVRALLLVGLLMLIENPMILLYDPSFQLSFLATLGLIILAGPLERRLSFITDRFGFRGIVASSLATQIFVSLFILHMMGQISIIGIVVNILVLPLIPLTMLSVFITGLTGMLIPAVAGPFAWISHVLLSYELLIVERFAQLPIASVKIDPFSFWWVAGFYLIFAVIIIWISYFRPFPNSG